MSKNFLSRIKSSSNQFTKAEKKVAEYVLKNPQKAMFMSITDLAEACNVGDTSVFRFCKTMKLKGYQEFRVMLSLAQREDDRSDDRLAGEVELSDSFEELSQKVLNTNIQALQETFSLLNQENFEKAITILEEAHRIYFFGVGASGLAAMKAMNKFLRIEPKVYCLTDSHMQAIAAASLEQEDAAVLISYSGATKDTVQVADIAKKRGARTICITRFVKSPLIAFSDVTLLCGANEGPLQGGSTSAEISQLFLIDLLYMEYYRRHYNHCRTNNEKSSRAVMEKQY